ncbi:hypothetical protein K438DRAFT_1824143 [Mycena galopus ATCC 62051]|nr:hypothetical protein K438DRAFT_1824143 [Mycena galopus ATCC 62051]
MSQANQCRARFVERDTERIVPLRELNEVASPALRLPPELSSEIFLHCLPPFPKPRPHEAPMLFLNICSKWRAVALGTPDMWTAVAIDFAGAGGLADVLSLWFRRAGNRPLSVSLRGNLDDWDRCVCAVIGRHAARLKHLEIHPYHPNGDADVEIDLFRDITREPMPLLETLSICCSIGEMNFPGDDILRLLDRAPNIVECTLLSILGGYMDNSTEPVVVPTLRRLIFGDYGYYTCDRLIQFLSLPALEVLSAPFAGINTNELRLFLVRSTPPLQELAVSCTHRRSFVEEREYLELIPSLARFSIWRPGSEFVVNLFVALADSPSLLPNLSSLTIDMTPEPQYIPSDIAEASWQTILRAVSTRRIQFSLYGVHRKPPANVLAACAQMVPDVYISGSWESCRDSGIEA